MLQNPLVRLKVWLGIEPKPKQSLPRWIQTREWMAVPATALRNLPCKLSPVESAIYMLILRATIGNTREGRPRQAAFTIADFAEHACVDTRSIETALVCMRSKRVILCIQRGHQVFYSVRDYSLSGLPDRTPRVLREAH